MLVAASLNIRLSWNDRGVALMHTAPQPNTDAVSSWQKKVGNLQRWIFTRFSALHYLVTISYNSMLIQTVRYAVHNCA